jgi:hypothetical protein
VHLRSSGLELLPFRGCRVRSLELALLFDFSLSAASAPLHSGDPNLCDDFEAAKFEKNDFDKSRPRSWGCSEGEGGGCSEGEGGNCGTPVIVAETVPSIVESLERFEAAPLLDNTVCPKLDCCMKGEPGIDLGDSGVPGDLGELGLSVDALRGCRLSIAGPAALKLSAMGAFDLGMLR